MVPQRFFDMRGDQGVHTFEGWRCLTCGEASDPVILYNRTHRPAPEVSRARVG